MKYQITFFLLMLFIFPHPVLAGEGEYSTDVCVFEHLAINGKDLQAGRHTQRYEELEGMKMPVYIGYFTEIYEVPYKVKSLKFTRTADFKFVDDIEEFFQQIERKQGVHDYDYGFIPMDDPMFMRFVYEQLNYKGVYDFKSEIFSSFEPYPSKSNFTAEDFEFENICVYRPFDDPPEFCDKLEIKLKNDPKVESAAATQ